VILRLNHFASSFYANCILIYAPRTDRYAGLDMAIKWQGWRFTKNLKTWNDEQLHVTCKGIDDKNWSDLAKDGIALANPPNFLSAFAIVATQNWMFGCNVRGVWHSNFPFPWASNSTTPSDTVCHRVDLTSVPTKGHLNFSNGLSRTK